MTVCSYFLVIHRIWFSEISEAEFFHFFSLFLKVANELAVNMSSIEKGTMDMRMPL